MFPCYQRYLLPASLGLAFACCGGPEVPVPIESETPIHLEDHLESALVESALPLTDLPGQRDWTFEDQDASCKSLAGDRGSHHGTERSKERSRSA